ncbi:AAA family ATPase [Planctomycetaceae bacterium]|nr:AAA family ATPase [Planctomycetaceae bacterium]
MSGKYDSLLKNSSESKGSGEDSSTKKKPTVISPKIIRLSDVEPEEVCWLWQARIAIGKLTLIAGDPGLGKSFLTCDLAARVSRGRKWPDGAAGIQGGVIFISGEDDPGDTIRPRLDAADADVTKIELLQAVSVQWDANEPGREKSVSLKTDLKVIEGLLKDRPDCRLIIIDPLSAHIGEIDSHKNADVRSVLSPLGELASRYGVAVVAVEHLNKRQGTSAIHRLQGSIGIVGAARAVWLVARDPNDGENRLFLPIKNNLGNDQSGLSYKLVQQSGAMTACLHWSDKPVMISADQLMNPSPGGSGSGVVNDAEDWLADFLRTGPQPSVEIWEASKAEGFSKHAVTKAKKRLGITARKMGADAGWQWSLPEESEGGVCESTVSSAPSTETRGKPPFQESEESEEDAPTHTSPSTLFEQSGTDADLQYPF